MSRATNTPEATVLIRKNGKILFVLRQNTGWGDGLYTMPGGHVEAGESFTQAAIREAQEEAGVSIQPEHLRPLHTLHRLGGPDDVRVGVLFEATDWSGEPRNMEPERHSDLVWFDEHALPYDTIIAFQAEALRSLRAGNHYGEMGWK